MPSLTLLTDQRRRRAIREADALRSCILARAARRTDGRPRSATSRPGPVCRRLGRPGDRGLIARISDVPVGAVWIRLFGDEDHGYGSVDDQTPELSIAVVEVHRRCGIGRSLLAAMLAQACLDGVARVNLSVEKDNPARSLYAAEMRRYLDAGKPVPVQGGIRDEWGEPSLRPF